MMNWMNPAGLTICILLMPACNAARPGPGAPGDEQSADAPETAGEPGQNEDEGRPELPKTPATDADRLAERGPVGRVVESPGGPVNQPVPHPLARSQDETWPDLAIADLTGTWRLRSTSGQLDCVLSLGPAGRSRPGTVTANQPCAFVPVDLTWVYLPDTAQLVLLSEPGQAFWRGQRRGAMEFRAMKDGELLIMSPSGK